jgi:hypothetical protein
MKAWRIFIVLLIVVMGQKAFGQEVQAGSGLESTNPQKLQYVIEDLNNDAKNIGLRKDRITTKIELKLRSFGIEPTTEAVSSDGFLYINIVGDAFNIDLEYYRYVQYWTRTEVYSMTAATWRIGGGGSHWGKAEWIVSGLDQNIDTFLNAFLKANPKN